ncbi:MAG: heparinase II/III family protein [Bacteroidales bacterium]|nr:heparinase II/III family protein [Bacteroidales bacterium]
MKRCFLLSLLLLSCLALRAQLQPHPRLLMTETPRPAATWYAQKADSMITAFSREVLSQPPVKRELLGRRLLGVSREALKRIFWLSYTWRAHGGEAYARRAIEEMIAASRFQDWNPSHFLDVGEMTMALAIGYDWLYTAMTPEERQEVARAIVEKGLKPALNASDAWFYTTDINWNSVCNAGMVFGALAVWEEDPAFCREMLEKSVASKELAYKAYSADGGFPEGYNYWGYGTSFQILLEAALATACPQMLQPLPQGFLESARFMQFMSTPAGRCFSFSDCYFSANFQFMQAWMALKTGNPSLLFPELKLFEMGRKPAEERLLPFFLLTLQQASRQEIPVPEGHTYHCGGTTPVYIYREGWEDPEDDYLGIKGGLAQSSHSHLDQGSFYFESEGVAWATDLGMQNYNSLESIGLEIWDMTQESDRWEVFRIGPWSHNILTVNGHAPKVYRPAGFSGFFDDARKGAVLDLSPLYDEDLASYKREVYLEDGSLHVLDCLEAGDHPCHVRWALCTEASVLVQDCTLLLESGERQRMLKAGPGNEVVLEAGVWSTAFPGEHLHEWDEPNPDRALAGFTFSLEAGQTRQVHIVLERLR